MSTPSPIRLVGACILLAVFGCQTAPQQAMEGPTPEDAKAMVAKAIALYDAEGPVRAFTTMNSPGSGYRDGELYVFVLDPNNQTVAHAADPSRVGNDTNLTQDADGRPIGPLLRDAAAPGGGWAEYRFTNFESGQVEPKSSCVVLKDGYVFGSGIYSSQS